MSNFLTDHGVVVALVCAAAAVVYGAVTSRSLLALSPGNETMRGLSLAIQEGASAYLRRQYRTIGIVGVVLFLALIPLQNIEVAIGFLIGGLASAVRTLARTEMFMPMKPAAPDSTAPTRKPIATSMPRK